MIKKVLIGIGALACALAATGAMLYANNKTPIVPRLTAADLAAPKPYVIKLHAQWCPVCMTTKDVWSKIDVRYSGKVNLVVFDFTDEAAVAASEAEATRLGLGGFFADYGGWTGTIVIVGVNKDVRAELHGTRDFDEYATAIDAAIAAATKDSP